MDGALSARIYRFDEAALLASLALAVHRSDSLRDGLLEASDQGDRVRARLAALIDVIEVSAEQLWPPQPEK